MDTQNCFHCGLDIIKRRRNYFDTKISVVTVVKRSTNFQSEWFDVLLWFWKSWSNPQDSTGKYDFFDNESIVSKLWNFKKIQPQLFHLIPHIHCSSCIWILENLQRLQEGISTSQVISRKKSPITFNPEVVSIKTIVYLLSSIGYEPYISLEN
jgi:Cu+-exporting ATPase